MYGVYVRVKEKRAARERPSEKRSEDFLVDGFVCVRRGNGAVAARVSVKQQRGSYPRPIEPERGQRKRRERERNKRKKEKSEREE